MKKTYQKIEPSDAYGISILAQVAPELRKKIYEEFLMGNLRPRGRHLARKMISESHAGNGATAH